MCINYLWEEGKKHELRYRDKSPWLCMYAFIYAHNTVKLQRCEQISNIHKIFTFLFHIFGLGKMHVKMKFQSRYWWRYGDRNTNSQTKQIKTTAKIIRREINMKLNYVFKKKRKKNKDYERNGARRKGAEETTKIKTSRMRNQWMFQRTSLHRRCTSPNDKYSTTFPLRFAPFSGDTCVQICKRLCFINYV